jgi:transposase
MTPLYAWAASGARAFDTKPANRGGNISMVGALKKSGMQPIYPYDGPIDAERFVDFIEHKLKPTLKDGDVIIMDNCRTHYAKVVSDKLKSLSIDTLFMPPYSPELNPIEESWSVIKTRLKQKKPRNIADYVDALMDAKKSIDAKMAEAFFNHASSFQTLC